jgi:UDP:flavonoid glycosyltransferase YjiC (YdhE family)
MRCLLASWGSSGDFHPFLGLAAALRARGHTVTFVGNPEWRAKAEAAVPGLRFVPAFAKTAADLIRAHPEMLDTRNFGLVSFRHLVEKGIAPILAETCAVLRAEAERHDVLVGHHFTFPAALIHELTGIPWATVTLAPGVTPSAHAMPAASELVALPLPGLLGEAMHRTIWAVGARAIAPLLDPAVNRVRAELGLPPARDHMFSARSPRLVLHLYSPRFAPPPPDWDARHVVAGFCFDPSPEPTLPPEVKAFLAAGESPRLFTLGTTVVAHPQDFFAAAAASVADTPRRALLLIGSEENRPVDLPPNVLAVPYLSHGVILPRCAAVAHQCGAGTMASALRAGTPTAACPVAFDQPNNAARLAALGLARIVPRKQRTAAGFARAFQILLSGDTPRRAKEFATALAEEDGPATACAAIEERLG